MGIIDQIKTIFSSNPEHEEPEVCQQLKNLVLKLAEEVIQRDGQQYISRIILSDLPSYKEISSKDEKDKIKIIFIAIEINNEILLERINRTSATYAVSTNESNRLDTNKTLIKLLLTSVKHISYSDISLINQGITKHIEHSYVWPISSLIILFEKIIREENEVNPSIATILKEFIRRFGQKEHVYIEDTKSVDRVKLLLDYNSERGIVLANDTVATTIKESLDKDPKRFNTLLQFATSQGDKSVPTKKWLEEAKQFLADDLEVEMTSWFDALILNFKEVHKNNHWEFERVDDSTINYLKGMVWITSIINSDTLNTKVEELGLICFKKLQSVGALSVKLGNATIFAFSNLPYEDGIERLTRYRMKIKYPSVLKLIENTIQRVALSQGKTLDELEELAVSDFGFDKNHQSTQKIGDYNAILTISTYNKVELSWENDNGKTQKSIPLNIKNEYKDELKILKAKHKDIESSLSAQKSRIESFYLKNRVWDFESWKKSYFDHKFMAYLSHPLIWVFEKGEENLGSYLYTEETFSNPNKKITPAELEGSTVRLWHPINASVLEVQDWRTFLLTNTISQPFKQAFREIYLVTEAELNTDTYSNRFAAHVLQQYQFSALCQQRRWKYSLMGAWDSYNTPFLAVPAYGLKVEFWVESDDNENNITDSGIFNYVHTDQVRIFNKDVQLRMGEVPKIVFSEVMRDVDLFVGVTSIGNNTEWTDQGNDRYNSYWHNYSFQDLSVSSLERKKTLEYLVPKLKIKDIATFEDKYLVIKGKIRTYKIHIGSGNILMKPNDQYLCIVPDRSKNDSKVFLPFEGDQTLSIIISKAFLLADDDKITDKTITSQLSL